MIWVVWGWCFRLLLIVVDLGEFGLELWVDFGLLFLVFGFAWDLCG